MPELVPLQSNKITTKKLFILIFLILSLNALSSCDSKSKKGYGNAVTDTIKPSEVKQSDSSLAVLLKARKVYVGDFDTMLKRRIIRVLVPYSRTLFFNDMGRESGLTAENFRQFEEFLNRKYRKHGQDVPFTVVFIPTPRDQLISHVIQGLGDIAAGNLTATEKRLREVDFMTPKELGRVSEIVITRIQDGVITNAEQLSGKAVYVRKSSSYYESLELLNKTLTAKGKMQVGINIVSDDLEDEDLMEMLNAGIISAIVVDDWMAKLWAQVLPNIRMNEQASVRTGAHIGFAYRKNSPLLAAELNDFYYNFLKPSGIAYLLKKYYRNVKHLQDPTNSGNSQRYREIMQLFEKYGKEYGFDPLMLAAMGFQESKLIQNERSSAGAIGVMQIMPSTGAEMKVGDIRVTEHNIHAATKYMNILMTRYFQDARFNEVNKSLFAFASYNAGPSKIASLRKIAVNRGLDPNVWLNSVEIIASEELGIETTTYVRNVFKYYCSYKLMQASSKENQEQRKEF